MNAFYSSTYPPNNSQQGNGLFLFLKVASLNNSLLLDKLRQEAADIWKTDIAGWTCLHYAVEVRVVCWKLIKNERYRCKDGAILPGVAFFRPMQP